MIKSNWGLILLAVFLTAACESIEVQPAYNEALSQFLVKELSLQPFNQEHFNSNVQQVAAYVNQGLIIPYKYVSETPGSSAQKKVMLDSMENNRQQIREQLAPFLVASSWFRMFLELPVLETADSYCQKASLSTSELLSALGIPTRQIHMTENGVGFHQFLDYWHPYKRHWVIIDPFYGIQYRDQDLNLIGSEQALEIQIDHWADRVACREGGDQSILLLPGALGNGMESRLENFSVSFQLRLNAVGCWLLAVG